MKRSVLFALAGVAACVLPAHARAACDPPTAKPAWIDLAPPDLASVFGRPGLNLAVSTGAFPASMRAAGAKTVYIDMYLRARVGTPTAPVDPATLEEKAERLVRFAATQTACDTPWIALNELFGASLTTPWSATNSRYRANVLAFTRALAARGARPFLLVSSRPYRGTDEAAQWWRDLAQTADIVQEVYFAAPSLWQQGPILANRRLRAAFRRAVASYTAIGIPVTRIGLMLGFQTGPGTGGRERLQPSNAWFETVKWQALSVKQVVREMKFATIWSWGWPTYSAAAADPDKPRAACIYLWARDPRFCDGPAVADPGFDASRREGQLVLRPGAQCVVGPNTISTTQIARLKRLSDDRDVAYSALLARLVEAQRAPVSARQIVAAERAVIDARFGGNRGAYRAALARSRVSVQVARGIIADELRRLKIGATLHVPRPSARAQAAFYLAYPDLLARPVRAVPAPWWLGGRTTGLAIESFAPPQLFSVPSGRQLTVRTLQGPYAAKPLGKPRPLGSIPLTRARRSIAAVLTASERDSAVLQWSARAQISALREAVCRRDDLPVPSSIELIDYLPFLALPG